MSVVCAGMSVVCLCCVFVVSVDVWVCLLCVRVCLLCVLCVLCVCVYVVCCVCNVCDVFCVFCVFCVVYVSVLCACVLCCVYVLCSVLAQVISLKVALLQRVHLFVLVLSGFFCIHVRGWQAIEVMQGWFNVIRGPRPPSVRWPQAQSSHQPVKVVHNVSAATRTMSGDRSIQGRWRQGRPFNPDVALESARKCVAGLEAAISAMLSNGLDEKSAEVRTLQDSLMKAKRRTRGSPRGPGEGCSGVHRASPETFGGPRCSPHRVGERVGGGASQVASFANASGGHAQTPARQGDPLMPLLFSLGQHPALEAVQQQCPDHTVMAFLDDIYLVSKTQEVREGYVSVERELWRHAKHLEFGRHQTRNL